MVPRVLVGDGKAQLGDGELMTFAQYLHFRFEESLIGLALLVVFLPVAYLWLKRRER